jgi:hypothetical protein
MPWNDWQFWIATLGALVAVGFMLRPLLSRRQEQCGGCGPAPEARSRRTALTIGSTERERGT